LDNAANAGILAAQIIGTANKEVKANLEQYKQDLADKVMKSVDALNEKGYKTLIGG
jgi:5-(carboxyamino)imidazole ribonucleotide mutase